MRLTVGPLPAAVYWRRRAVVLVGLAMVVLVLSYSCGGPSEGSAGPPVDTTATTPPATETEPPHPTTASPTPTPTPTPTAFSLVSTPPTGACTDDEIELTASAAASTVALGQEIEVTIKIRNTSTRTCSRDVGADAQELRLQDSSGIVWSSDDCNPRHGSDLRSFTAGTGASFTLKWSGLRSRSGVGAPVCTGTQPPTPGVYDLVARLDKKMSAPFALKVATA